MTERTKLMLILVIACIFIALVVIKFVTKKVIKVVALVLIASTLFGGGKIIDLNTLSADSQEKISQVVQVAGDSYVKTEGSTVYIKVNNEWVDVSKVSVIGDMATKKITLKYDDRTIEIGNSGLVNTIKALEAVGLIGDEK